MDRGFYAIIFLIIGIFIFVKVVPYLIDRYDKKMREEDIEIRINHKKIDILAHRIFFVVVFTGLLYASIHSFFALAETGFYVKGGLNRLEALVGGVMGMIVFPFFYVVFNGIKKDELKELCTARDAETC